MNFRKLIITTVAAASLLTIPGAVLATTPQEAREQGFTFTPDFQGVESRGSLIDSVINIVNALLALAAIAAVVFVIIGGVRYVTAQGDEDAVAQAKNTVIYAIVGIIVIILAAVIVNFFTAQLATGRS